MIIDAHCHLWNTYITSHVLHPKHPRIYQGIQKQAEQISPELLLELMNESKINARAFDFLFTICKRSSFTCARVVFLFRCIM